MATKLKRTVKRVTMKENDMARRCLVVYLTEGDLFGIREQGRRRVWWTSLHRLFPTVVRWNLDAERVAKAKQQKEQRAATTR